MALSEFFVCQDRVLYYAPKNYHLFKVVENRMQQCCAAHIVHSCEQYNLFSIVRVNTYRGITSLPTFFVRMLGKLLLASNTQSKMAHHLLTTGGTCQACAVDHFLPGRMKKSGYMKMSLSQVQLYTSV